MHHFNMVLESPSWDNYTNEIKCIHTEKKKVEQLCLFDDSVVL